MCHQTFNAIRALSFPPEHKAAKPVLVALAAFKNHETGDCFPNVETLAETLQFAVSTVYAALKFLRDLGHIRPTTVHISGREVPGYEIVAEGIPATGQKILITGVILNIDKPEPEPEPQRVTANSSPPTPRSRWSFVPDNLSPDMLQHAESKGLSDETVVREHESFVDHHKMKGVRNVDWFAAWRIWIARHLERRRDLANRARRESGPRGSFTAAAQRAGANLRDQEVRRAGFGDLREVDMLAGPRGGGWSDR